MVKTKQTYNGFCIDEPVWDELIKANNDFHDSVNYINRGNLYVAFVNYLNWVIDYCDAELNGKNYCDEQIIQKVFITKASKDNQYNEYLKFSFVPLREYASHLLKNLQSEKLENYFTLIMNLLADVGNLLKNYEVHCKGKEDFELRVGGRKTMSAWDLLNVSAQLFNIESAKSINDLSIIDLKPNVMFQIRQLLEIVGKNLIGFVAIVDNNGSPIHQFTQVAWTFLSSESRRKWSVSLPYKAKDIQAINRWTNSFVHTTYFNTCYLQYYALRIVQDLMRPVQQTSIFGNLWNSDYGNFKIDGYYYLRKDFEAYIRRQKESANVIWQPLKRVGAYIKSTGRPKVLFVMHMPPPVHGASMVGKSIRDSQWINKLFDCNYINLATASSISDIGKFSWKKIKDYLKLLWKVHKSVKQGEPELVYITPNAKGGAFFKDFLVVQMVKHLGCNVVAHYHNKGVSTKQDSKIYDWAYRHFFNGLKVILLSPALYQDVKKYAKPMDTYYCANGIAEIHRGKMPIRNNNIPNLLFLSNLIEAKGVIVLLDALKILVDKGFSFNCTFVGAESQKIDAQKFSSLVEDRGLQEKIKYVGKQYGEDKYRIYEETDIFVFPTYYHNECFPLVLLEAMRQGIPCVSTDEGAISDIIDDGKTGFIVEKKTPTQLAERLERLLNDIQLRKDMGRAGKNKFDQEFTLGKFEERMVEILGLCLA